MVLPSSTPFPATNQNSSSGNWEASAPYPQDQRKDTVVIDYVSSEAHHIRLTILNNLYDYTTPFEENFDRTPQHWHWPTGRHDHGWRSTQ
jgi:hypothetical protein